MDPALSLEQQADDERALTADWGAVTIERDVVRASGPDAQSFLEGQLSQDVDQLPLGASALSFLLQPQGKLVALLRVTRADEDAFLLDTDGGFGPNLLAALNRFKLRVKCDLEPLDWTCVAVRGPNAAELFAVGEVAGARDATAVEAAWPGFAGYDLLGDAAVPPPGVRVCSLAAFEVERIAAGVPRMGAELDERTIPAESGLVDRAVSFTKGCYTGQELVARIDSRGHVNRHLRRLTVEGDARPPGGAVIRAGDTDSEAGRDVGAVTSAAWSSSRSRTVALAYVRREVEPPATVELRWDEETAVARVEP